MVQEFHVLRCFSCRTFQVQQVKKSKKWSCKLCGEKQSLVKEYGRGTGADCRRHVQKLNSLRGELLEVENERVWVQWEREDECDVEVGPADETRCLERKGPTQGASRWSKYVDQTENEPECDEDEHEEEDGVYTDPEQCRQHNYIRKRKKSFTSGAACGRYAVGRHEDVDTARRGATALPCRPRQHDGTFKPLPQVPLRSSAGFAGASTSQRTNDLCDSPVASLAPGSHSTGAHKRSSVELSAKPQHSKDSKWARFLPSGCVEVDKVEGDRSEHAQHVPADHSVLTRSPVTPVATVPPKNAGCHGGEGAQLDKGFGVEKLAVFEKPSHRANGNACRRPNSPPITSKPVCSQQPVCVQPLPIKRPCPALSMSTLFHTDEDFDDAYQSLTSCDSNTGNVNRNGGGKN